MGALSMTSPLNPSPFIAKQTITETFLARVQKSPAQVAFLTKTHFEESSQKDSHKDSWKKITFQDFFDECQDISNGLHTLGVLPHHTVILMSSTRYEWSLCDISILGCGGITVPIYPSNTPEDMAYIINHSEARIVILEDAKQLQKFIDRKQQSPDAFPLLQQIVLIDPNSLTVFDQPNLSSLVTELRKLTLTLSELKNRGRTHTKLYPHRFREQLLAAKPDDLFTICYTSGTTGIPKGVMLCHDSMMSVMEDVIKVMGDHIRPDAEIILSFLPYSHILGRMESMTLYTFGWQTAFAENFDKLMANIAEIRPTIIFVVPRIFEKAYNVIKGIVDTGPWAYQTLFKWGYNVGLRHVDAILKDKPRSLKLFVEHKLAETLIFKKVALRFGGRLSFAISGGAPLPLEVGEFFKVMGLRILEGYGLTETCAPVTFNTPGHTRFGTVGRPLPDVLFKIAADGEILIKSRKVFKGYFKAPEATAEAIKDGFFHTGDIGYIDSDGFLHITDRKKDLIVTAAGKNIAPQKIENLAKLYPWVNQVVIHGDRRNYLTALFTLDQTLVTKFANDNNILFSEYKELIKNPRIISKVQSIVDDVNKQLASYETIKKFTILPQEFTIAAGELTPSLKIKRKFITERFKPLLDMMYEDSPIKAHS